MGQGDSDFADCTLSCFQYNNQKEQAACLMEDALWKSFGWLRNLEEVLKHKN